MTPAAPPTQYDAIAQDYQRSKDTPLRRHVEGWTLMQLVGGTEGLAVLDAGCGEGHYARQLRAAGAAHVLGIDNSPGMIALAREATPDDAGIEYRCVAAEDLDLPARHDLVLAAYLLHYARDAATLARQCRALAAALRPGGRLVALIENPRQSVADYAGHDRYGFSKVALEPRAEGSRIGYTLVSGRRLLRFETHYFSAATYERELAAAGFEGVVWHPLRLDPAAGARDDWQGYLDNPPVLALTAMRAGGAVGAGG